MTIADNVRPDVAAKLERLAGNRLASNRDSSRILAMAAGKPGSPFSRDSHGKLRRNGRFAAVK